MEEWNYTFTKIREKEIKPVRMTKVLVSYLGMGSYKRLILKLLDFKRA